MGWVVSTIRLYLIITSSVEFGAFLLQPIQRPPSKSIERKSGNVRMLMEGGKNFLCTDFNSKVGKTY